MSAQTITDSEYVVIGGGAVGCGVAYSLLKAGVKSLLLLERAADVSQVTSSQGAGLCGQPRNTVERTKLAMHSVATFRELQKDSKVQPEWHEVGSLRIALTERRAEEFNQLKRVADQAGLQTDFLDATSARNLFPRMRFDSATSILWCPSDGYMRPYAVASSYAYQCRKMGAQIATQTAVENLTMRDGRITGVVTNRGSIQCKYVINAAGTNAYHVAKLAGLELPIVPVRHEYYVTVAVPDLTPELPCFRIPDLTLYGRACDGGVLLGGWEKTSMHTDPRSFALGSEPPPVKPDWQVLNQFEADVEPILPGAKGTEKSRVGRGWPTFTPDGRFIIGESRRAKGFVMAGGCNAHGISGSAGIGQLLVQSLMDNNPSEYVKSLSPDRFTETTWNWADASKQAAHVYETYYGV